MGKSDTGRMVNMISIGGAGYIPLKDKDQLRKYLDILEVRFYKDLKLFNKIYQY